MAPLDRRDRVELDARERANRLLDLAARPASRTWRVALRRDRDTAQRGERDRAHPEFLPAGSGLRCTRCPSGIADVEIDEALVRSSCVARAVRRARRVTRGSSGRACDNSVWVVEESGRSGSRGERLRCRSSSASSPCFRGLARSVPLPIPMPRLVGRESELFPEAVLRASDPARRRACRCARSPTSIASSSALSSAALPAERSMRRRPGTRSIPNARFPSIRTVVRTWPFASSRTRRARSTSSTRSKPSVVEPVELEARARSST